MYVAGMAYWPADEPISGGVEIWNLRKRTEMHTKQVTEQASDGGIDCVSPRVQLQIRVWVGPDILAETEQI